VPQFKLQLWPGYQTSIRQHDEGILLCSEITHKVMKTETVYDMLMDIIRYNRDYKDEFRRKVLGMVVLTDYNNRTYRISEVNFDARPTDTFDMKGKETSYIEYYNLVS